MVLTGIDDVDYVSEVMKVPGVSEFTDQADAEPQWLESRRTLFMCNRAIRNHHNGFRKPGLESTIGSSDKCGQLLCLCV